MFAHTSHSSIEAKLRGTREYPSLGLRPKLGNFSWLSRISAAAAILSGEALWARQSWDMLGQTIVGPVAERSLLTARLRALSFNGGGVPGERKQKLTIPALWEGRLRFVCELRPRCDTAQSTAWRPSRREDFHSQELAIRLKNSPDEIPPDLLTLACPFPEGYALRRKVLQLFRSEAASWRTIICRTATNGVVGKSESRASRFLIDIAKLRPRFREAGGFGANGLRSTSAY
jgi:hypothetical protein